MASLGLEVSGNDIITLVLVNDTKVAGRGARVAIDVIAERRDDNLASALGDLDGLEELVGVAEGDLAKDISGREAVDTVLDVPCECD